METKPRVLDLFCGAGGMSLGFEMAGFVIEAAFDNWNDALKTIQYNKPNVHTALVDMFDISNTRRALKEIGDIDVVIGGPPCQGFSIAGKRDPQDPRNRLYKSFIEALQVKSPRAFVMENVPTISSPTNKELFNEILEDLMKLGYKTYHQVLLASNYGVAQNRRRMFVVGIKQDIDADFEFPEQSGITYTTSDAISDLPENSITDGSPYPTNPQSALQKDLRKGSTAVFNHQITAHSEATKSVIAKVPDGGNYKDLPVELQGIRNVNIAWTRFASDKPSHTIDTGHRHHFHYEYPRVPTAREAARLQSFPDQYVFMGSKTSQMKQIGNAVPPRLAMEMGKAILKFF